MDKQLAKALIAFRLFNKRGPIKPHIKEFEHRWGKRCVIITDPETKTWAMYCLAWASISRMQCWHEKSGKPYFEPKYEEAKPNAISPRSD